MKKQEGFYEEYIFIRTIPVEDHNRDRKRKYTNETVFQVSTGKEENGCVREGKCSQERESKSKNEKARIINKEETENCEMGKVYQRGKIHAEEGGHTTEREGKHACE